MEQNNSGEPVSKPAQANFSATSAPRESIMKSKRKVLLLISCSQCWGSAREAGVVRSESEGQKARVTHPREAQEDKEQGAIQYSGSRVAV